RICDLRRAGPCRDGTGLAQPGSRVGHVADPELPTVSMLATLAGLYPGSPSRRLHPRPRISLAYGYHRPTSHRTDWRVSHQRERLALAPVAGVAPLRADQQPHRALAHA